MQLNLNLNKTFCKTRFTC